MESSYSPRGTCVGPRRSSRYHGVFPTLEIQVVLSTTAYGR